MPSFPKEQNYRNRRLLDLAAECPHCFYCGETNHGHVVPCHANMQKFGKGMGEKASDVPIAFMCNLCHDLYDARMGKHLTQQERDLIFYEAACKTWLWMMQEKRLRLA